MGAVTIIGEQLAKKGTEFVYLGPLIECRNCKVKTVCFNLRPYHAYKIINIRDKKHACNVHDGPGVVVEVEELPIRTTIDKKLSKGSIAQLEPHRCDHVFCEYYDICTTQAIQKGRKYRIEDIFKDVNCAKKEPFVEADILEV
jgi:uncharacterized protein